MKNAFRILILLMIFLSGTINISIAQKSTEIQWMSFEEAVKKSEKKPKKMFIDVYTHWCGWCKRMDATTFVDPTVVKYMSEKFYAVKMDAETRDTIHFRDKIFVFSPQYKSNEIAVSLLKGQMSYPTSVYLDENFNLLGPVPGYLPANDLLSILKYFGEDIYKTKSWDDYRNEVQGKK